MFQVRIHCIDYCLAAPTKADFAASCAPIVRNSGGSKDNGQADKEVRVPVIRVFGATTTGQIACAHIHGVFPYLFVPFDGFHFSDSDRVIANLRNGIDQFVGRATVLAITLVRGIPFYGFHVGFRLYLKIYLLDPSLMTRVAEMLRQGRIAGIPQLLPHESHIPFLLQFMTDYNLYGCDLLDVAEALPRPSGSSAGSCPVEVDVFAHSIRNRHAVPERWQHEDLPEVPTDPNQRLVYSMAALWREMAARYNKKGKKSAEERKIWEMISTQDAFAQLGASSSDPRRTPAPWIHEDEYKEQIADIIESERLRNTLCRPREPLEEYLPTIRQSVEDFYPKSARSENKKRKRECGQDQDGSHDGVESNDEAAVVACAKKPRSQKHRLSGSNAPPSPDFEQQLGVLLSKHEGKPETATLSNEWLRSQQSEPSRSQDPPSRKRHQKDIKEAHRPLSQTFSVVKSAFPREDETKLSQPIPDAGGNDAEGADGLVIPSTPDNQLEQLSTPQQDEKTQRVATDAFAVPGTPKEARGNGEVKVEEAAWPAKPTGPFYHISQNVLAISRRPPAAKDIMVSLAKFGAEEIHQDVHFSEDADVPRSKMGQPGLGITASFLPEFAPFGGPGVDNRQDQPIKSPRKQRAALDSWEFAMLPPSRREVETWLDDELRTEAVTRQSQVTEEDATQQQMAKGQLSQEQRAALRPPRPALQLDMRTLCLEVHANSRGTFLPNPERDAVQCIFWRASGGGDIIANDGTDSLHVDDKNGGIISVARPLRDDFCVDVATDERDLLRRVIRLVHILDPDILAGYEVVASSWGYLNERAALYDIDLWQELSRVPQPRVVPFHERGQGVTGRYMLSINQAMRANVDLRQYTLESAAWHVLGRRVPFYRPHVLTAWEVSGRPRDFNRLIRHYRRRAAVSLALIDATELVARTSEQARVLGVDFASVLDRGSQFKVESVMLRVAKPENFVMPSPNHEQVGQQNAAECTPLVLEPRSAFYSSPVVVLDFTSLYPSLMIAYNLCYSTFAGRLDPIYHEKKSAAAVQEIKAEAKQHDDGLASSETPENKTANSVKDETADIIAKHHEKAATKMGFTTYERPSGLLERLSQLGVVIAPTGMMYVGARTRQSLLAKMLAEILDTRAMVKVAIKKTAATKMAERQRLHNRQLALKLLANVTYGYTSASFSGRMPCVEVADSIVQTGRQTLDRAIVLIHSVKRWGAEVVYGDTDSLFVHLPGRTREQAFQIGAEMAEAVTASNPHPVRLKFEKVYHPCVLLAKKRYVGYEFDTPQQTKPIFDAKGIETVRRDGSPASAKILEECLRILFDSADLSRVKAYVQARFDDVINNRLSMADLCFAKEVKQPGSYRAPPPGAVVASRRMAQDPRAMLIHGERVPYVVIAGPPGTPLRDRCVAPEEVVKNRQLRIDSDYYIQNSLIPPLDRIFRLVDVDVLRWYLEMPKARMPLRTIDPAPTQQVPGAYIGQQTLDTWLSGSRCARCDQLVRRRRRRGPELREDILGGGAAAAVAAASAAAATVVSKSEVNTSTESDGDVDDNGNGNDAPSVLGMDQDWDLGTGSESERGPDAAGAPSPPPGAKTPVLCKSCGKDNLGTLMHLQARTRDAELAYREILNGCRSCAGLGPRDEVRCENLTCPVYFVRTERAVQAKIERSKAPLMEILARRGMRDLEW